MIVCEFVTVQYFGKPHNVCLECIHDSFSTDYTIQIVPERDEVTESDPDLDLSKFVKRFCTSLQNQTLSISINKNIVNVECEKESNVHLNQNTQFYLEFLRITAFQL